MLFRDLFSSDLKKNSNENNYNNNDKNDNNDRI